MFSSDEHLVTDDEEMESNTYLSNASTVDDVDDIRDPVIVHAG